MLVTVHFTVAAEREADFLAAMEELRGSRLRTGASRWELYRDAEHPDRFVEMFSVPSWEEHLRQHEGRLTAIGPGGRGGRAGVLRPTRPSQSPAAP